VARRAMEPVGALERLPPAKEASPAAALAGEFRLAGIHFRSAFPRHEVAAEIYSELGLGHRGDDGHHQHAALPLAYFELQNNAKNAARGAGNQSHSRTLQEVLHARSAKSGNE